MAENWKDVIDHAREELAQLEAEREGIDKRILQLKRIIFAASEMIQDASGSFWNIKEELDALGITEFCREIFRYQRKGMTPLEVRSALLARGIDLSRQKNIMASIHTVLKRLVAQRYLVVETAPDGGTAYRNPMPRSLFRRRRKLDAFVGKVAKSADSPVSLVSEK
ncbi:MAG: hypothetical protein WB763_01120 [Terriglobia bacterium]|jgi:hypothetical protein